MNERINVLIEQAGLEYNFDPMAWLKYEKLVELVVRECAQVADVADENKCEWIGGNILTHFGVKE